MQIEDTVFRMNFIFNLIDISIFLNTFFQSCLSKHLLVSEKTDIAIKNHLVYFGFRITFIMHNKGLDGKFSLPRTGIYMFLTEGEKRGP